MVSKIKVLFVCRKIPFYNISPIMSRQGSELTKLGIKVDYFAIDGKGMFGYLSHIFKLKKYLKSNKYDIIHAHYGLCGFTAGLGSGNEKKVISFMGSELIESTKKANKLNLKFIIIHLMNAYCLRVYDYIIVKSKQMANQTKNNNLQVIPNGINLTDFFPVSKIEACNTLNLKGNNYYALFVSDPPNRPEKNIALAEEAINLLNKKGINITLLKIHSKSQEELNLYYSAVDLLLLTSLHEGSPNVIKEAMACNCPIVSTKVGDVEMNIRNIEGCYLTNFDKNEIAEKIEKSIDFRKKNKFTNSREKILELGLSAESSAKKIKNIYEKLLEK